MWKKRVARELSKAFEQVFSFLPSCFLPSLISFLLPFFMSLFIFCIYIVLFTLLPISVWSFDRKTYTWSSPKSSHSWNPADFTMKSGGFHEIRRISWNPWNPADFTMKSGGFHHEIRRISWNPWNPADFMKSGGFHHEIWRISGKIHPNLIKSDIWAKTLLMFQQKLFWFYKVWVDFTWNPPDFMKSARFHLKSAGFHEIRRISYGFHEIRQISYGFHEIRRISCEIERPLQGIVTLCFHFWSLERPILGDHPKSSHSMKFGGFHVKSTYKTYKSNISTKTLQFYGVLWEGYVMFSREIRRILCEIHRISKDQLPGMVSPMFFSFSNIFFSAVTMSPFCGATGILCFGLQLILPMDFKARVDVPSPVLFVACT